MRGIGQYDAIVQRLNGSEIMRQLVALGIPEAAELCDLMREYKGRQGIANYYYCRSESQSITD